MSNTAHSPTFVKIVEDYKAALLKDENFDDTLVEAMAQLLESDEAISKPKIESILFQENGQ